MSKWRYGCDKEIKVYVPRGWDYKEIIARCGSTSHTGGVNQCADCRRKFEPPEPREDEGDLEWDHRANGGDE